MNAKDIERVDDDVENLSRSNQVAQEAITEQLPNSSHPIEPMSAYMAEDDQDLDIVSGTEADVTAEDLVTLGDKNADFGRKHALDNTEIEEDDLDVPGSEDDDANEDIGEEDEENNYYSLGGDAHENLEEDNS